MANLLARNENFSDLHDLSMGKLCVYEGWEKGKEVVQLCCSSWELLHCHMPKPQRPAPSTDWHCHADTGDGTFKLVQSSQGMIWCHIPTNSSLSIKLVFPEETHFCWTTPSQLSRRAKAVCKSAPHRLFHLNDLPSLAGLSLSRACIQGNKSYQGKNGSKKLLKPQYPF